MTLYIGKWNDRLEQISWCAVRSDNGEVPRIKEAGDPLRGERFAVDWSELVPAGLDLRVEIPEEMWLDRIVVRFAPRSEPIEVALYTADLSRRLDLYRGETGCAIAACEIALQAGGLYDEVVIRIEAELSDVILEGVDLYGASRTGDGLYPTPAHTVYTEGASLAVADCLTVRADGEAACGAMAVLEEKWAEATGLFLTHDAMGKLCLTERADVAANGYTLAVNEDGTIVIEASDLRGFVQGAETLIKLIDGDRIPVCRIEDAPFCEFRGVHLFLPAVERMDYAKRLIKYILSPMGYNHIILELAGAMEFRSHPEINEAFLEANRRAEAGQWPPCPHGAVGERQIVSQESVRELIAYARRFGIEIIPEIQSLGHVQFMTQAHPEIAERPAEAKRYEATDERLADVPPNDFYAHCFCPSNPRSYEILFDLMEEILELFRPARYVHMGHDEIYQIGVCPTCAKRDPADLLTEDLCRLHDYLAARGLTMMIWSDMLQPVTKYRTPPARTRIPKDIVMLDFIWYFHTDKDIEDNLLAEGFDVIMGNMYSSHYPRYESRIRKTGMRGAQVSAWVSTNEESLAREGKLYDLLYSAQMLWSDSYTAHARYSYDRMIAALLPHLREQMKDVRYPSLTAHTETALSERPLVELTAPVPPLSISPNGRFDSLVIEHTATRPLHRVPWIALEEIGAYVIRYADGEEVTIPVTYAGNIAHHARRHHQPFTHKYYRHNGYMTAWETDAAEEYTEDGERVTLYRIEWINPHPDREIVQLSYRPATAATEVFTRRVIGVRV